MLRFGRSVLGCGGGSISVEMVSGVGGMRRRGEVGGLGW